MKRHPVGRQANRASASDADAMGRQDDSPTGPLIEQDRTAYQRQCQESMGLDPRRGRHRHHFHPGCTECELQGRCWISTRLGTSSAHGNCSQHVPSERTGARYGQPNGATNLGPICGVKPGSYSIWCRCSGRCSIPYGYAVLPRVPQWRAATWLYAYGPSRHASSHGPVRSIQTLG